MSKRSLCVVKGQTETQEGNSKALANKFIFIMDILRPTLINIKGRVYRKNFVQEDNYEEQEDLSYIGPPGRFC